MPFGTDDATVVEVTTVIDLTAPPQVDGSVVVPPLTVRPGVTTSGVSVTVTVSPGVKCVLPLYSSTTDPATADPRDEHARFPAATSAPYLTFLAALAVSPPGSKTSAEVAPMETPRTAMVVTRTTAARPLPVGASAIARLRTPKARRRRDRRWICPERPGRRIALRSDGAQARH